MNYSMPAGTTLKGLGLNLILEDTEFLPRQEAAVKTSIFFTGQHPRDAPS